jgi:MFS transporter, DHA1 family, tetracycline resistance protein
MHKKASLSVIFITVFIDLMGFGILVPILPTFATKELGVSDFGIGIVIGIYSLTQFLLNPVFGKISDKIGRRPIVLISLLCTAVSYVIFSFSTTFLMLLFSRILAGFGGSNVAVAQAYIADITTKEDRSKGMGLIGAAFGLGFVFGPVIGGWLSGYGYMYAGLASAAFSLLAFTFAFFALPESHVKRDETRKIEFKVFDFQYTRNILKLPTLGLLISLTFITVFSVANIYGTFALLGYKVYGFTDRQTGYLFGIIGIMGAFMQGGMIRVLSKKYSDKSMIAWGTLLMAIGLGALPYGANFLGVALIVSVLGIGSGLLQPVLMSMVSKYSPEDQQGAILGVNQSFSSMARVLGPIWGGFTFEVIGYSSPFLTGGIFIFFTFILILVFLKADKKNA